MDLTNGLTWTVIVAVYAVDGDADGKGAVAGVGAGAVAGDDCDCLAGLQKGSGKIARARKAKEVRENNF